MPVQCGNCSAPSPDGKRFCGDCGALLDTSFGAIRQYLDANLRREIQATIKEEFCDQKLIEVATAEAIAEKLASWAKLLEFFVGIPVVLFLFTLGTLGFTSYSDLSKKVKDAKEDVEKKVSNFKVEGDKLQGDYMRLEAQLASTNALATQVRELTPWMARCSLMKAIMA